MTRRLPALLAVLSLLLCAAAAAMWVRGAGRTYDEVSFARGGHFFWAVSLNGRFILCGVSGWPVDQPPVWQSPRGRIRFRAAVTIGQPHTTLVEWYPHLWIFRGPAVVHPGGIPGQPATPGWCVTFHWRTAAAALAGVNVLSLSLRVGAAVRGRRRPRAAGLCGACGYDLRATPGRCPECGRAADGGATSPIDGAAAR